VPQEPTRENADRDIGDCLLVHANVIEAVSQAHRVELIVIGGAEIRTPEEGGEAARCLLSLGIEAQRLRQLSSRRRKLAQAFEHDGQMEPMTGARALVSYGARETLLG
jgi:hypothetical protein